DFALVVAAAAPGADRATHPSFHWTSISARNRVPSRPANLASRTVQLPVINLVAQVLLPKLNRIHLDLPGEFVHERLNRERSLRMTRRAHRNRRIFVRVQRIDL